MTGSAATKISSAGSHCEVTVGGATFAADPAGALYWPGERLLIVADLHLEKGSSFARYGSLLPPYDTAATLARLASLIGQYAPRAVVSLGDSFHDGDGPGRLLDHDLITLRNLQRGREWLWLAGNHDSDPVSGIGGAFMQALSVGNVVFRHRPQTDTRIAEIAGHLHPVARVNGRGGTVRRRCFASDGARMVMPAFGAYAGGLNIRDRAFAAVFDTAGFTAHLLGKDRLYAIDARRCLPG